MLASRFLRPPHEVRHHALYNLFERVFAGMLSGYKTGLRWSLAHRRTMMVVTLAVTLLTGRALLADPEGLHPVAGHRPDLRPGRGGRGHLLRRDGAPPAGGRRDPAGRPQHRGVHVLGRRARRHGRLQHRLLLHPPQAAQRAQAHRRRGRQGAAAASCRRSPACASTCRTRRRSRSAAARRAASTSSRSQGPDTDELYRAAPLLEAKMRAHPLLVDVTTDLLLKNPQINVDINRDKASALGVTAQQIEDTLYTAYGTRQISTIFAPHQPVPGDHGAAARVPDRHPGPVAALRPLDAAARWCRSTRWSRVSPGIGPLHGQPLRPAAVGHALVQPAARRARSARPRPRSSASRARRCRPRISASFQGTAQAFQSSMQGLGLLLVVCDPRHLHGAGHPLRELHPPVHDPLGAAARRRSARSRRC